MSDRRTRMKPEARREHILGVAMDIAIKQGYDAVTRERIAEQGGISTGLVSKVFNTMNQLHRAVMRAAIHRSELPIIAHGIASGCRIAHGADEVLKRQALEWMITNGISDEDGE